MEELFVLVSSRSPARQDVKQLWDRLAIEDRLFSIWNHDGDPRIHAATLQCVARVLRSMSDESRRDLLTPRFVAEVNRAGFKSNLDVWVQCRALDVLVELRPNDATQILLRRLKRLHGGDDLFVRRYVLKRIEQLFRGGRYRETVLPPAEREPSDFVRQQFARAAYFSDDPDNRTQWRQLARHDRAPQVRAAALLVVSETPVDAVDQFDSLECLVDALENESDSFVIRVALHTIEVIVRQSSPASNSRRPCLVREYYHQRIEPAIMSLIANSDCVPVRRFAAQTGERVWSVLDERARALIETIDKPLREIPVGQTRRFAPAQFKGISDRELGRILATLTIDDFGLDVHRRPWGVYITRGPVFGFRIWRCLFEATHPATDKRQALRHTVGRINAAPLRVPSQICGELSQTKVPGEPLTIADDGTWRPFLPLVDDMIAVLNQSWLTVRPVHLVSTQGVTRLKAPKSIFRRLMAATVLNLRFADYADARNWNGDSSSPVAFVNSLRGLGFQIEFENHRGAESCVVDDSVERFFASKRPNERRRFWSRLGNVFSRKRRGNDRDAESTPRAACCNVDQERRAEASLAFGLFGDSALSGLHVRDGITDWFQRFRDYFSAAFENTLEHLLLFTGVVVCIVVLKHLWSNAQLHWAREKIPLSIGGWGTRGKSGTERLKAALIGSIGHGLVSKTTGCEAMFIHADAFSEPLEIPLFRPFDKATIWEQSDLLRTVARMKPSAFLWECMALTPAYVDVLQRQWTRDDLSTITNTYPDHEDLQGPAGHNVAQTIAGFVPQRARLIASEEQMRPYLTESCRAAESTFRGVGWLESGLVTDDVLERLPYKEHPDNVALVAALGEELGVDYDVAVKAMGDYLVPDLGVLKTHPISSVKTRKIQFTNGMSANERFGCMGNWHRLGFDRQDPWQSPTTWICGVVNNRADRVPRSKVFAKILVEDLHADRFFLIGNNLEGLRGFIEDAWEDHARSLTLRDSEHDMRWDRQHALDVLRDAAFRYRQVIDQEQLQRRLSACVHAAARWSAADAATLVAKVAPLIDQVEVLKSELIAFGVSSKLVASIAAHHREWLSSIKEYRDAEQRIHAGNEADVDQIERDYVSMLRTWFFRKLVTLHDYDASGEEVVSFVVDETPPGFTNRVIGLQNIKGTGLDFVYRFQEWDTCHQACLAALDAQTAVAQRGLETLVSMPSIGQLCEQAVWCVVKQAGQSKTLLRSDLQTMVQTLEQRLKRMSASSESARRSATMADDASTDPQSGQGAGDDASQSGRRSKWFRWLFRYGEELLDLTDSLKRRKKADRVYVDLAKGRIGRQRAIAVLRSINHRQKGGWLTK